MKKQKLKIPHKENNSSRVGAAKRRLIVFACLLYIFGASIFCSIQISKAREQAEKQILSANGFRVGERLTYNITFEKFSDAAYAEIYTVSRGKLGERDAVELRGRLKTRDFVSAAFYLLDETRTTFASAENGLPLYVRKISNAGVLPKETVGNFTVNQTTHNDLLTLMQQIRNAGGAGSFSLLEDEKVYNVTVQSGAAEKIKTDAGDFETTISTVQSEYLTEKGITNLRINFSSDEFRVPVSIRFKTAKGDFLAQLASLQINEPETVVEPTPTPVQTPRPQPTPKPVATPTPYVENEPLSKDLPFVLGETLEYQVTNNGQMLGLVALQVKERKLFQNEDSLLLTATVTESQGAQQILFLNNEIKSWVATDTLAPRQSELNLSGFLAAYNQKLIFDQKTGFVTGGKFGTTEIPVGTHNVLSLAYAIRSFNLKPSKDPNNPVNDTRVAVFLDSRAYVLILRPSSGDIINLRGEKVSAQLISISARNPAIDQYNLRLWLSNDEKRLPLRLAFGTYQADLVSEKQIPPK